jgi:outer membrane protein W
MKSRIHLVVFSLFLAAAPAAGQIFSVSGFASWVDPSGRSSFQIDEGTSDLEQIDFDSEQGWGAAANFHLSRRISFEVAASLVEPDLTARVNEPQVPFEFTEGLQMIPITGILQFHLAPGASFDPYIGAGVAYVLYDDIEGTDELDEIEVERIDFDDDLGYAVNAGVGWYMTRNLGLYLDAKYVLSKSSATAVFTEGPGVDAQEVKVDPLILAAGLTLRF